jgi:hypothetical protein
MDSLKAQFTSGVRKQIFQKEAPPKEPPAEDARPSKPCCESRKTGKLRPNALSSKDIMYATECREFYYKDTDEVVKSGDPIGFDMDIGEGVELVLFDNIYWSPDY